MPTGIFDRLATLLPSRRILTCSKAVAAAQVRLWPKRPMAIVYPPVALEQFNSETLPPMSTMRSRLGLQQDVTIVGIVGRLQQWKGIHVLIEAMPAILHAHPNTLCIVVGGVHSLEPEYPAYLARQIQTLGLDERVQLVGLKSNVSEWMQAMDVVVHASDHEPFGMVVIEAMALGKPVVAGAQGGPNEIITPGVDGLLVEYGDAKNLAVAVLRYLKDELYAQKVGRAASLRAADFSTNCYTQAFVRAVQGL
jgi:glycosyltransferase involved in cell wall biosynthesis